MVQISITPDRIFLEVKGSHKFWSLRSQLDVPLEHVKAVHLDPKPAMGWFQGWKIAGTDLPNIFRAGMFYQDGDKVFWDVRHPKKTIVSELEDESCAKLIVEVKDPVKAVAEIEKAIADYRASKELAAQELEEFVSGLRTATPVDVSESKRKVRQKG